MRLRRGDGRGARRRAWGAAVLGQRPVDPSTNPFTTPLIRVTSLCGSTYALYSMYSLSAVAQKG